VKKIISRLRSVIDRFFERNGSRISRVIAFFTRGSIELGLVREYVDYTILGDMPPINFSYDNNTSEVYCHPRLWSKFVSSLRRLGVIR